jgi:hypothetical protein
MSDLDQIRAIKTNTLEQMVQVSSERKPSYAENGQKFDWTQYLEYLQRRVDWCNQQLIAEEPFEVDSQGFVE